MDIGKIYCELRSKGVPVVKVNLDDPTLTLDEFVKRFITPATKAAEDDWRLYSFQRVSG